MSRRTIAREVLVPDTSPSEHSSTRWSARCRSSCLGGELPHERRGAAWAVAACRPGWRGGPQHRPGRIARLEQPAAGVHDQDAFSNRCDPRVLRPTERPFPAQATQAVRPLRSNPPAPSAERPAPGKSRPGRPVGHSRASSRPSSHRPAVLPARGAAPGRRCASHPAAPTREQAQHNQNRGVILPQREAAKAPKVARASAESWPKRGLPKSRSGAAGRNRLPVRLYHRPNEAWI